MMGETLNYKEQLKIANMTYIDKAIKLFRYFPKEDAYFHALFNSLQYSRKYIRFSYSTYGNITLDVDVPNIGILRKHLDDTEEGVSLFSISFHRNSNTDFIKTENLNRNDADLVCERALPFLLSNGNNKIGIPLLVNDFPEFAKFALEYRS